MDIAFCYEHVLPSRGGCETYIAGLAHRLVADGHQVHLYACSWDPHALSPAVRCHRLDLPSCPRFLRPWAFNAACARALAGQGHDVTVGFDRIPCVDIIYPQSGLYAANAEHNLLKYASPAERLLMRGVKWLDPGHLSHLILERSLYRSRRPAVVAISDMVRRQCREYYGLPGEEVRVVRIAANPALLDEGDRPRRRRERRREWGVPPEAPAALFAGLNYRLKGLVPLLHALKQLHADEPFILLVAGKSESGPFERLARRLGVAGRVRFLGYRPDLRDGYFAADFLIHPTFYDPCSNVVLEALAFGLPVITSRYNGASELMHPPAEGFVLDDPHDVAALAGAIRTLLEPTARAACARAARQAAGRWTFEHHYRQLVGVFTELAAARQAA
jgi:UDP-glucose:(heptosyl)LPS alpha-1,3-glucosyltransferase